MRIVFILLFSCMALSSFGQLEKGRFYTSGRFSYQQGNIEMLGPESPSKAINRELIPSLGVVLGKNWAVGLIMGNYKYAENGEPITQAFPQNIYHPDGVFQVYYQYQTPTIFSNSLTQFGLEVRKFSPLSEKTFLNFAFQTRYGFGEGAFYQKFPPGIYYPCLNCLSIAPWPFKTAYDERMWQSNLSIGLTHFFKSWLALEVNANVAALTKSKRESQSIILPAYRADASSYPHIYTPTYFLIESKEFSSMLSGSSLQLGFLINFGKPF